MRLWIEILILSLVLTWIMETLVFLALGIRKRKDLLLLAVLNLLTNPVTVTIYDLQPFHHGFFSWSIQIALEVFVVLTEGSLLYKYMESRKNPWLASLAANGISYLCGVVYGIVIQWN